MNKSSIKVGLKVIKTHGARLLTAILSLALLVGMSACQSEQSSPAVSDAAPQVQAQANGQDRLRQEAKPHLAVLTLA